MPVTAMNENVKGRNGVRRMFGLALLLMAVSLLAIPAAMQQGALPAWAERTSAGTGNGHFSTFAIATDQVYINRSQSAGTYVKEFVSFNNSSTLHALPYAAASGFNGCTWVTVLNATTTPAALKPFHAIRYASVTDANASGTVLAGLAKTSFDACAGSEYWVNYVYWTYSVYDFTAKVLGVNSTLAVTVGRYPATANAWPGNFTVAIGPKTVAQVIISSNLTFNVTATSPVSGATVCTASSFSQLCSYPQWAFSLWDQAASGTSVTTNPIVFGGATGITLVTGTYSNWTLTYTETNVTANTATGAFFVSLTGWLTLIFVDFWYVWLLLIVIVVVYYGATRKGRASRSKL